MQFIISSLFLLSTTSVMAQTTLKGRVAEPNGKAVEGAIVKVSDGEKVITYSVTDDKGQFELTLTTPISGLLLSAEAMGYTPVNQRVSTNSTTYNLMLQKQSAPIALKEVVMKAPPITERGDTLSYNLASYIGKGDYTLKDALKKLPGIDITDSGTIKYLGKQISNFYINGMDLLGGKYNIATTNIPATYVNTVQVLNNHQAVKMDKDVFSDAVAINVKISNKAKLKPMGTLEGIAGFGSKSLYQLSGAAMLFKSQFQAIATVKAGNIYRFATNDLADHLEESAPISLTKKLLGDLSTSTPPLDADRYASPEDRTFTVSLMKKLTKDATFRVNTGYGYSKSQYAYGMQRDYYDGNQAITIAQEFSPTAVLHQPAIGFEYKNNASTTYLSNTFSGQGAFLRSEIPTFEDRVSSFQQQELNDYNLSNKLDIRWKRAFWRWYVTSLLQYVATPPASISLNEDNQMLTQRADSRSFITKNSLTATYTRRNMNLYIPLLIHFTADKLHTSLIEPTQNQQDNRNKGQKLSLAFSPQYEYTHPQRRFILRTRLALQGDYLANRVITGKTFRKWFFTAAPELYFNYMINPRSTLRLDTNYGRTFGDLLDFLTVPVQTDLTTQRISSGIPADNRNFTASLHYDFKLPLDMWFFNADVIYRQDRNNLLASQEVTPRIITLKDIFHPNTSKNLHTEVSLTKQFQSIRTKVSLRATYTYMKQQQLQNGLPLQTTGQTFALLPTLSSQPCRYFELNYRGDFDKTTSRYLTINKSYWSQTHNITLKLFPISTLQITTSTAITRRELTEDLTKTMALLDAGLTLRLKAFRLSLDLRNLLNQRTYAYTLYNSVNTYTYNYQLRGRELLFSLSYTK